MTEPGPPDRHGVGPGEWDAVVAAAGPVPAGPVTAELIYSDAAASATAGIWRFRVGGWSAVVKLIRHATGGSGMWQSGAEVGHWYYWRREALAYSSALLTELAPTVGAPRCFGVFDRADGGVAIWLEDLASSRSASDWALADYHSAARALGWAQGRAAAGAPWAQPWLARDWVRSYVERRAVFLPVLADGAAWEDPVVRYHLPAGARAGAQELWEDRQDLLRLIESQPQTLCHNDLHPGNLFSAGTTTVLIDWAFLGSGPLGTDPGNLIADAVLDFYVPAEQLPDLSERLVEGYLEGVEDSGWRCEPDQLRRAIWATAAVKFFWIPAAMVDAVQQGRSTLNRRPLADGLAAWGPAVAELLELGRRARSGGGP